MSEPLEWGIKMIPDGRYILSPDWLNESDEDIAEYVNHAKILIDDIDNEMFDPLDLSGNWIQYGSIVWNWVDRIAYVYDGTDDAVNAFCDLTGQ